MRILVTGSNGFIGKYLVGSLIERGHEVFCHDSSKGSLTERNSLDIYQEIDFVYHLAALTFVPESWSNTFGYFETNILGTVTVLEFCRKHSCGLVFMSTYIYGEPEYLPIDENHQVSAVSPYHESKIIGEELCRFYHEKFGVQSIVFRPFNIYGAGQNKNFLLAKVVDQILDPNVQEVSVFDLRPKRDYIYIKDMIEVLLLALHKKNEFEVYNLGSGISYSVEEAIKLIMKVTGIKKPYFSVGNTRKDDILDCVADISSIHERFGYEIQYSFEDGLRDWLQK